MVARVDCPTIPGGDGTIRIREGPVQLWLFRSTSRRRNVIGRVWVGRIRLRMAGRDAGVGVEAAVVIWREWDTATL